MEHSPPIAPTPAKTSLAFFVVRFPVAKKERRITALLDRGHDMGQL
jgi:hypothetical protein